MNQVTEFQQAANIANSIVNTYTLKPLATMPANWTPELGNRFCRVIVKGAEAKEAGKVSQFCQLPELTDNFVQGFISTPKGVGIVKDFIEGLQNAVVRKVYLSHNRSANDTDLSIEALYDIAEETLETVRLTKDVIGKQFDSVWMLRIAYCLVLERDAAGSLVLAGEDVEAKEQFWKTETGCKYLKIASNYKQFFVMGAERKPSFVSQAVKDKVLVAVSYLDSDVIVDKLVDKLSNAPIASEDMLAL